MILEQLSGLSLELVDESLVEQLSFNGSSVSATLGEHAGAVYAPILEVHLNAEQELIFRGAAIDLCWAKIVLYANELVVMRNGQPATYKILSRRLPRRPYLP